MLLELNEEQVRLQGVVVDEYLALLVRPTPYDEVAVRAWLAVAYGEYQLPVPARIEVVDSPAAAIAIASSLTGEAVDGTDRCGICDAGWVAQYDYWWRAGVLSDEEAAQVRALKGFLSCAWDMLLLDECAIVVRRPSLITLDAEGELHSTGGAPCLSWADGGRLWAHHGTWITERIAADPRSHTAKEYLAIVDTEVRRSLSERAGWDWVAELLEATVQDRWTDPGTGLEYELLRHPGGALLRKRSPPLADGSQPWYVEPVHEDLRHARAARTWQVVRTLTPSQCEASPGLVFGSES